MKKIIILYVLVTLIVTTASFVTQRMNGKMYSYEWYRTNQAKEMGFYDETNDTTGEESEYDKHIMSIINKKSNPTNLIEKYTFSYRGGFDLKELSWLLMLFIASLPIVMIKKYTKYSQVFFAGSVSLLLGAIGYQTSSMEWFGYYNGLAGFAPIIYYWLVLPTILIIETICILIYIHRKNSSEVTELAS